MAALMAINPYGSGRAVRRGRQRGDLVLGQALRDLPTPIGAVAVLGRLDVLPGEQRLQRHRLGRRASS